jgi:hypothetical protein
MRIALPVPTPAHIIAAMLFASSFVPLGTANTDTFSLENLFMPIGAKGDKLNVVSRKEVHSYSYGLPYTTRGINGQAVLGISKRAADIFTYPPPEFPPVTDLTIDKPETRNAPNPPRQPRINRSAPLAQVR